MVLDFQVLGSPGTRVPEQGTRHDDGTVGGLSASVLHDEEGAEGHAVDGQVKLATRVADGEGEATVVRAHQVDHLPFVA